MTARWEETGGSEEGVWKVRKKQREGKTRMQTSRPADRQEDIGKYHLDVANAGGPESLSCMLATYTMIFRYISTLII